MQRERERFELTTLVVIGTDCIGNCKSNYYTITTTTALKKICAAYIIMRTTSKVQVFWYQYDRYSNGKISENVIDCYDYFYKLWKCLTFNTRSLHLGQKLLFGSQVVRSWARAWCVLSQKRVVYTKLDIYSCCYLHM